MAIDPMDIRKWMTDISDNNPIDDAIVRGVRQALAIHKRLGESVVSVVDGKTVVIPPEEIDVDIEESKHPRGLEALRSKRD